MKTEKYLLYLLIALFLFSWGAILFKRDGDSEQVEVTPSSKLPGLPSEEPTQNQPEQRVPLVSTGEQSPNKHTENKILKKDKPSKDPDSEDETPNARDAYSLVKKQKNSK